MNDERSLANFSLPGVRVLLACLLAACASGSDQSSGATPGASGGTGAPSSGGGGASVGGAGAPAGGGGSTPTGAGGSGPAPPSGNDGGAVIDAPVGSGSGGSGPPPSSDPAALPLVVTDHFQNRGWLGDESLPPFFKAGLIVESSTAGLCASRPPGAKGQCIQVKYNPPAGLVPPGPPVVPFVGEYFLTTLRASHLDQDKGAVVGSSNWGIEPGVPVMPGARQVSFYAAAEQAGLKVAFVVGTSKDTAVTPKRPESLGAAWTRYTLPLAGVQTGPSLLGGFGWTIGDTTKPATFYLDGIVWEAEGDQMPVPPMGKRDGVRQWLFMNRCKQTIWVGFASDNAKPEGGGFQLDAGQTKPITFPPGKWQGRFWPRTGCNFDGGGAGSCQTGDCAGGLHCTSANKPPATLGEIAMPADPMEPDFYDLSMVDGFNVPMAMAPLPGSNAQHLGAPWDCGIPTCFPDVNATCPAGQKVAGGCISACEQTHQDEFCCAGAFNQPQNCPAFPQSRFFKSLCPTTYSYAYDDQSSTFTCRGEDYAVWFCPEPGKP